MQGWAVTFFIIRVSPASTLQLEPIIWRFHVARLRFDFGVWRLYQMTAVCNWCHYSERQWTATVAEWVYPCVLRVFFPMFNFIKKGSGFTQATMTFGLAEIWDETLTYRFSIQVSIGRHGLLSYCGPGHIDETLLPQMQKHSHLCAAYHPIFNTV